MMLENNVRALEAVTALSPEGIAAKISQVKTAGAFSRPVLETLPEAPSVVAALDNADCTGGLAGIVSANPSGVAAGLVACGAITGARDVLVVIPTSFVGDIDALMDALGRCGVSAKVEVADMVNAKLHAADAKVHLVTLAAIGQALVGEEPSAVVCVEDGLKEIPFGSTLRQVLPAQDVRAVLINHTFMPASVLDEPLSADRALGDGRVVPVGEHDCIVGATVSALKELRGKSCGKCTFCREGLYQLWMTFSDIEKARGKAADLDLVRELCDVMPSSSNCSLGEVASMPCSSALETFGGEIDAHLRKHSCPVGQCQAYLSIYVDPQLCQGTGDCIDVCPVGCIEGRGGFISMIDEFDCTKCGKCIEACPEKAITYAEGRLPSLPERLTRVGRFRRR